MLADIRDRLRSKGIHELRQIARAVGVAHPADGRKDRLINEIVQIASCNLQPAPRSARGAPPKSAEYDKKLVSDIEECVEYFSAVDRGTDENAPSDFAASDKSEPDFACKGVLQVGEKYAFLRTSPFASSNDVFVHESYISRFSLKNGDFIEGECRNRGEGEFAGLTTVKYVNGLSPQSIVRNDFSCADALYPSKRLNFIDEKSGLFERMCDMFSPMGFGQRALICGGARSGKTTLLKSIAAGICRVYSKFRPVVLLIGQRPEEITEIKKELSFADVIFTAFDRPPQDFSRAADFAADIMRSRAECGLDAVLLVDGLEKLWRVDSVAAKKLLALAKNTEGGATVTVIACLSDDFKECAELKESVNCYIKLSNGQSPAIDILNCGTIRRDLLQSLKERSAADRLRSMAKEGGNIQKIFEDFENNGEIVEEYGR